MEDHYKSLITDYIDGSLEANSLEEFNRYVEEGHIDMAEVESMMAFEEKLSNSPDLVPSEQLSKNFYSMLGEEKAKLAQKPSFNLQASLNEFLSTGFSTVAFGLAILVLGVIGGQLFSSKSYEGELSQLTSQMDDMKEMMMMSMLKERSASKRLQGLQISSDMVSENEQITDAMFATLNNDESTNVRLAALTILASYANDPEIRAGLINSITEQDSPTMQVALAELMAELQEPKAKEEFQSILEGENTPDEVKTTLRENLDKII